MDIDIEKIKEDQLILTGEALEKAQAFKFTSDEQTLVTAYRNHPEMQPAVNKMLDINSEDEAYTERKETGVLIGA